MAEWGARFFVFVLLCFGAGACRSAEINLLNEKIQGFSVISIKGEIEIGDDEKFEAIALTTNEAVVFLESPGGRIAPALKIGKAIRLRGYLSAIPYGAQCASACGLIWLGGKERLVFPGGSIGFHVAYLENDGRLQETGQGNAFVGAYLAQIGLPDRAIEYVTRASPNSMIWLTAVDAEKYGIDSYFVPSNDPSDLPPVGKTEPSPRVSPPSLVATPTFQRAPGRDIYGFDLSRAGLAVATAEECELACSRRKDCRAYTFNKRGKCYLKHGGDRLVWNNEVVSGYLSEIGSQLRPTKIVFYSSTSLKGDEYAFVLNSSIEECISKCESAPQCTGFTFSRDEKGKCSLRRGMLRKLQSKRVSSGVKTSE